MYKVLFEFVVLLYVHDVYHACSVYDVYVCMYVCMYVYVHACIYVLSF